MKSYHIIYTAALIAALGLSSCGSKSAQSNQEPKSQEVPVDYADILTSDSLLNVLVHAIPDQGMENSPEEMFSPLYYATLSEAWEIPDGGLGGLGNGVFLYYFVCDNGSCDDHSGKLKSIALHGDSAIMKFDILHPIGTICEHSFKLFYREGQWLIADYDNTLAKMQKYIADQRVYLLSDEYNAEAQAILENPEAGEDWKKAVSSELESVRRYFEKRPASLLETLIASGLNENRIKDLYIHIPNPNTFYRSENLDNYFTNRMTLLLNEAFAIPNDEIEGLGSFEVLFELNGGGFFEQSPKYKGYQIAPVDECRASVNVYLGHEEGGEYSITMQIVKGNGLWQIDALSTDSIMVNYIAQERAFFQSEEWTNNCKSSQKDIDECDDPQEKERMQMSLNTSIEAVRSYFEKYPVK